jgi:hypothetical protein
MHARVKSTAAMADRYVGMETVRDPSGVDVLLAPNRRYPGSGKGPANHDLAGPMGPLDERAVSWRDYVVRVNAYPYVPAHDEHTLIVTQGPETQHFEPRRLADMIDFQAALGPVTLHYNGIASNSEQHWHWQSTRETLPLQRRLDSGQLELDVLRRDSEGTLSSYDAGVFAGFLVQGTKGYVVSRATELVARLDGDPLTRGAYNLLLLKPLDGRVRLVVVPRRAVELEPGPANDKARGIGAMAVAGWYVVEKAALAEGELDDLRQAGRAAIVPPGELGWLEALRETRPSGDAFPGILKAA